MNKVDITLRVLGCFVSLVTTVLYLRRRDAQQYEQAQENRITEYWLDRAIRGYQRKDA